jgi:thiol-disulfide isomerase/thioredoxin
MITRPRSLSVALRAVGLVAFLGISSAWALAQASSPAGLWDGTVVAGGVEIPFRFEITGRGTEMTGSFFDGDLKMSSTAGRLDGNRLVLPFDQYGSTVDVIWSGDTLAGQYDRGGRGAPYPFSAKRAAASAPAMGQAPSIGGLWTIPTQSSKGEAAWRFIVRQTGSNVSAAILRVDGDTGTLSGSYKDGTFTLSHFSGARPLLLEVTPAADGSLTIVQNRRTTMTAVKADEARAKNVAEPTDPSKHTRMKDPLARLEFSFPNLDGKIVSNNDPKFQGKVVLVNIGGSWCPNCHDEAPFLGELYKKYRAQGLEIVLLSFEEAAQLQKPTRLRAFIKRYGIEYTVLLAGEPAQLNEKVPQAENLNAFPTTFVIGRNGLVHGVHAGFASPAAGAFHAQTKKEISDEVERLLAERATN